MTLSSSIESGFASFILYTYEGKHGASSRGNSISLSIYYICCVYKVRRRTVYL